MVRQGLCIPALPVFLPILLSHCFVAFRTRDLPTASLRQMTGLSGGGKLTILTKVVPKGVALDTTSPPTAFHMRTVPLPAMTLYAYSCDGGSNRAFAQALLDGMLSDAAVVVFVVDSGEPARFDAARQELEFLLAVDALAGVPLLVLASKADLPTAAAVTDVSAALHVSAISGRDVEVRACSGVTGAGLDAAFAWVRSHSRSRR